MPKDKYIDGRKSSKSQKTTKELSIDKQKVRKEKDENMTEQNTKKKLSLSFYNQETLCGSKKIILDLLPIQTINSDHSRIGRVDLEQHNKFRSLSRKQLMKQRKKNLNRKQNQLSQLYSDRKYKIVKVNKKNCSYRQSLSRQKKSNSANTLPVKKMLSSTRVRLSFMQIEQKKASDNKIENKFKLQNYLHRYFENLKQK